MVEVMMDFLEHVYKLELEHEEDKAYNKVTRHLESLLAKEKFYAVNELLKAVDLDKIEPWVQRAFLASTFPFKDKLPHRTTLHAQILSEIDKLQGPYVADSLIGDLI